MAWADFRAGALNICKMMHDLWLFHFFFFFFYSCFMTGFDLNLLRVWRFLRTTWNIEQNKLDDKPLHKGSNIMRHFITCMRYQHQTVKNMRLDHHYDWYHSIWNPIVNNNRQKNTLHTKWIIFVEIENKEKRYNTSHWIPLLQWKIVLNRNGTA